MFKKNCFLFAFFLISIFFYHSSCSYSSKDLFKNYDVGNSFEKEVNRRFIKTSLNKQVRTSDRINRLIEILQRKNNKVKDEIIQEELNEIIESLKGTFNQPMSTKILHNNWVIRPGK